MDLWQLYVRSLFKWSILSESEMSAWEKGEEWCGDRAARGASGMGLWEKVEGGRGEGENLKNSKELAFHQQTPAGQKLVRKQGW